MDYRNLFIDGVLCDVIVDNGRVKDVRTIAESEWHTRLEQHETMYAAFPGLCNMHTHSAMTLLRSAGSGLPLQQWLTESIFPREATLTAEMIHNGALDACKEMRHSGTTAFNDMYFSIESTVKAALQTGMSANIALSVTDADFADKRLVHRFLETAARLQDDIKGHGISLSIAPHSIYAVSGQHLKYIADFAAEQNMLFHVHLSETQKEREDCLRNEGLPPVLYLERLGVLQKTAGRFIGAHALWLDDKEIETLGKYRATVVHCPNSNLKLGSGCRFLYTELRDAGVNVTLGTDGCASSDNLDMIEAMKVMSLLQKGTRCNPSVLPADEVMQVASANGRRALGLPENNITAGNIADFFLVDINNQYFKGIDILTSTAAQRHIEFLNRLIYAANASIVSETITQ
jgi:5-methylthioadenosine/S-adenosylhomocysteine deaminase